MKIGNSSNTQRAASKRTNSPSIRQIFVKHRLLQTLCAADAIKLFRQRLFLARKTGSFVVYLPVLIAM